jgi:hypothetical protein
LGRCSALVLFLVTVGTPPLLWAWVTPSIAPSSTIIIAVAPSIATIYIWVSALCDKFTWCGLVARSIILSIVLVPDPSIYFVAVITLCRSLVVPWKSLLVIISSDSISDLRHGAYPLRVPLVEGNRFNHGYMYTHVPVLTAAIDANQNS